MKLDRYDRAIVRALQLDGRITNSQLAEKRQPVRIGVLETACAPLEESGFIEGYNRSHQSAKGRLSRERVRQHHVGTAGTGASSRILRKRRAKVSRGHGVLSHVRRVRLPAAGRAGRHRPTSSGCTASISRDLPNGGRGCIPSFALRTVQKSRELPVRDLPDR